MKQTKLTKSPADAAQYIIDGGIVAFPTETVYGLGANVFDEAAVAKIFVAKQRPADNPLIAHVSSVDQINELAAEVTGSAKKLIDRYFPGPLTVVLEKRKSVPGVATAGLDSIGVRMPRNEAAHAFLAACGTAVVAPSANLSGRPSPTTWQAVYEDLNGRIDCILQGDPTEIGLESTVIDCRTNIPIVLRLGAVSIEEMRSVVPEAVLMGSNDRAKVRSPGLRHKHYSPRACVKIVDLGTDISHFVNTGDKLGFIGFQPAGVPFSVVKVCTSVDDYARSLFEFFRKCDRQDVDEIFCEAVDESGIGAALMDRLRRAAEK